MSTEVKKLINMVHDVDLQIKNNFAGINAKGNDFKNKTVVLLLGPTGSGKTTLFYALTKKDLIVSQGNPFPILDVEKKDRDDHFQIGHDGRSKTTTPGLKYDQVSDIIFCDCPGFFDNKSDLQDATNSFAIHTVLSNAKNIKILLCASDSSIQSSKGKDLLESCYLVEKLFPNQNQIRDAIALIVTNMNPDYVDFPALEDVFTGKSWLLKLFQNSEVGKNRKVFYFPSPKVEMINGLYSGFQHKDKILSFIKETPSTNIVPRISLSDQALYLIIRSIDSFGCLSNLLLKYVDQIIIDYSEPNSNLKIWKDRVDQFCRERFFDPSDFVNKAQEIIKPSNPYYDDLYDKFMEIQTWRVFLEKIANEEYNQEEIELNRNSEIFKPVFLDITTYISELLKPCQIILSHKIDHECLKIKLDKTVDEIKKQQQLKEQIMKEEIDQKMKHLEEENRIDLETKKRQNEVEIARAKAEAERRNSRGRGRRFCNIC